MGYRTYLSQIPNREYNKIKSLDSQRLFERFRGEKHGDNMEDFYMGVYEFARELGGKDYLQIEAGNIKDAPKKSMLPFFKNKELQKEYSQDHDFFIVKKEFLAYVINLYQEKVKSYYRKNITPFYGEDGWGRSEFVKTGNYEALTEAEKLSISEMIQDYRSRGSDWGVNSQIIPFNLETGESISDSWKFEYSIFELVRIYKSFDWKRNVMVFYGY